MRFHENAFKEDYSGGAADFFRNRQKTVWNLAVAGAYGWLIAREENTTHTATALTLVKNAQNKCANSPKNQ